MTPARKATRITATIVPSTSMTEPLRIQLRCSDCGSAEVFAVAPGAEDLRSPFPIVRGRAARIWCWSCWRKQFIHEHINREQP